MAFLKTTSSRGRSRDLGDFWPAWRFSRPRATSRIVSSPRNPVLTQSQFDPSAARATPEKTPHPLRVLTSRMMTHVPEGPRPLACVPRPLGTAVLAMAATPAREDGAVAGLGEPRRPATAAAANVLRRRLSKKSGVSARIGGALLWAVTP